ncbi:MAG: hypothetical protein ACHQ50_14770 [Fimbriimonadales bacterium]
MLPTHRLVKTYKEAEIYLRNPGFEFTPMSLRKIASFICSTIDQRAVFAFSYSMLDFTNVEDLPDMKLLEEATGVIQDFIDERPIEDRQEYTYELRGTGFQPVRNPKWWIKV